MTTIETLTGEVNLRTSSAKAYAFHSPRKGSAGIEERPMGIAAKSGQTNTVIVPASAYAQRIPSVQGYAPDIGGSMSRMSYAVEDGEILKLFVQRRPGAGKLPVSACQFVRVRATAALRCIEAKLLTDPQVNEPLAYLRGRFDLITLDEALGLGVKVASGFQRMFHPANVEHVMTFATLAQESVKASIVQNADGQSVVVTQEKRRRSFGGF